MRFLPCLCLTIISFACVPSGVAQNPQNGLERIRQAKTIFFFNDTGSIEVGAKALVRLQQWGKFQIVSDKNSADLILLLSSDPYRGGQIIFSGGQTGTFDSRGHIEEDPVPTYVPKSATRYAYFTVVDARTGEKLWGAEHVWGGLLTGYNSVGSRLVAMLVKRTKQ